jgi:hypothetical protein
MADKFENDEDYIEFVKLLKKKKKPKYNARKVEIDGYTFDSQREAEQYQYLAALERAGQISNLEVHPRFTLFPRLYQNGKVLRPIRYTADFRYQEEGVDVVEDVKGVMTRDASLRINLFQRLYPGIIFRIVSS